MDSSPLAFLATIEQFGMDNALRERGCVIVGYSGGADSSCLLRLLQTWCQREGVSLAAAHVHHGIRGAEADRDEAFCRETCTALGIPLYVRHCSVPDFARREHIGLEEAARRIRYAFFDEVSEHLTGRRDGACIATAHHADDNLETVLFHLLRGSGTHGMCGISPLRDGRYLRPLLCDSRAAIRQWCSDHAVAYVEDSTNALSDCTRNRIRNTVIPALGDILPHPEAAAARLTALLRQDDDYLSTEAARYVTGTVIPRGNVRDLHVAVASRVLQQLFRRTFPDPDVPQPEETHIRAMLRLISGPNSDAQLSLPGKTVFRMNRETVGFFAQAEQNVPAYAGETVFSFPENGCRFENERFLLFFSEKNHICHVPDDKNNENIYKLSIHTSLRFDTIKGPLQVRYRMPGDACRFGGMTHKLKRLLNDAKLTAEEKAALPILTDGDGIVWVPGFPPREGCLAQKDDRNVLHLTFVTKSQTF